MVVGGDDVQSPVTNTPRARFKEGSLLGWVQIDNADAGIFYPSPPLPLLLVVVVAAIDARGTSTACEGKNREQASSSSLLRCHSLSAKLAANRLLGPANKIDVKNI